jgi:hypothetical protein
MSAELRCPVPRVEERHERLMVVVETALGACMPDGDLICFIAMAVPGITRNEIHEATPEAGVTHRELKQ